VPCTEPGTHLCPFSHFRGRLVRMDPQRSLLTIEFEECPPHKYYCSPTSHRRPFLRQFLLAPLSRTFPLHTFLAFQLYCARRHSAPQRRYRDETHQKYRRLGFALSSKGPFPQRKRSAPPPLSIRAPALPTPWSHSFQKPQFPPPQESVFFLLLSDSLRPDVFFVGYHHFRAFIIGSW